MPQLLFISSQRERRLLFEWH